MRQIVFAVIAAMATFSASAKTYELALELSVNGRPVAAPRLLVAAGVTSSVQIDDTFIDVVARDEPKLQGMLVSFSIGKMEHGARTVLATPAIVAAAGQRAEVRVVPDTNRPDGQPLMLAVTAKPR